MLLGAVLGTHLKYYAEKHRTATFLMQKKYSVLFICFFFNNKMSRQSPGEVAPSNHEICSQAFCVLPWIWVEEGYLLFWCWGEVNVSITISILVFLGNLVKIQLLPLRNHREHLSSAILPAPLKWESHQLCPQEESKQQQRWKPVCMWKRRILLKASEVSWEA